MSPEDGWWLEVAGIRVNQLTPREGDIAFTLRHWAEGLMTLANWEM